MEVAGEACFYSFWKALSICGHQVALQDSLLGRPLLRLPGAQLCLGVEPLLCALPCTDQILSQAATQPPPQPPLPFLTGHSTRGIRRL